MKGWLRRLLIASAILFLLCGIIATIGYFNRAKLLTLALKRAAAPNRLTADATRFDGLEGISFDGVSVFAPGESTPFAKADSVSAKFDIEGLQRFHLDSLAFSGLVLDLPPAMLERPTPSEDPEKPAPPSSRTLSLGSLSLPDTEITATLPDGTTIFANVSCRGSDISLTGGSLYAKEQKIAITDARATLPDGTSVSLTNASSTIDFLPEPLLKNTTLSGTTTLPGSAAPLTFSIEIPALSPTKKTGTGTLNLSGSPIAGLDLEGLETNLSWAPDGITLSELKLSGGSFDYAFDPASPQTATTPKTPNTPPPLPNIPPIRVASASTTLDLDLKNVPGCGDVTTRCTLDLTDVTYQDGAAKSTSRQSISFSNARIKLLDDIGTASAETAYASVALTPESAIPATLHELTITGGKFSSVASPTQGRPALIGKFEASSAAGKTSLQVIDVSASTPDPDAPAFTSISKISVTLDPTSFLDTRHIDSVTISGASTTISDPVLAYLKGTKTASSPATVPDAVPPESEASWTLGEFSIAQSSAILADILPGLPPLPFAINTTLQDIPLSRQGFIESEIPQTLTLSKVTLGSQLNPLVPVIQFGELSVNFTLGGLLREEIDSIVVTKPDLYIGKHLFWYISYFQEQPKEDAEASPEPTTDAGGWTIRDIEAVDGSLILAPQGHPAPGIKPLPFAGRTRLINGQLNFDIVDPEAPDDEGSGKLVSISIPKGDYPLNAFNLDLEANLVGLRGEVAFNLPVTDKNTNFVETLEADRIVFEQFELTEAFIVVTYDQEGVYAEFGGYAYGGYTKGEVNLYLDQDWSWDGWITATAIDFDSLTETLTPTTIRITGTGDAEVIADGDLKALEHLTSRAKLNATKSGTLDIVALAEVVKNLSPETPALTRQLATVGLDVLEKFDYEKASINIATSGYEGNATLDLSGPSGRRTIEIESHDVRFRPPTVTSTP